VVIIGGGISGTAAAYELSRAGARVVLCERGELASMASGWTLAGVRQSGRHPAELPLASHAVRRWATLGEELGADIEYRRGGNLRLALDDDQVATISGVVADAREEGLDLTFLPDNRAVREVAPALAETIVAASWCPTDGHANPTATVLAYAAAAVRLGATILTNTTVDAIVVEGGKTVGVRTDGGFLAADVVIVVAGIYSDRLLAPLGLALPLTPRHVSVIQTVPMPPLLGPVLGTAKAIFAGRQQADGRLRFTGGSQPWTPSDTAVFADSVQPPAGAVARTIATGMSLLPALAEAPVAKVWGGLIDMTPDGLPVIERSAAVDGLVIAAGFCGHGFCLGPTTGQIICELTTMASSTLPLEPFRLDRFSGSASAPAELHG